MRGSGRAACRLYVAATDRHPSSCQAKASQQDPLFFTKTSHHQSSAPLELTSFENMRALLKIIALSFLCKYSNGFAPSRNYQIIQSQRNPAPLREQNSIIKNKAQKSNDEETNKTNKKPLGKQLRRSFLISASLALTTNLGLAVAAPPGFKRIPTQFIAAIADPKASSGSDANEWGVWTVDPGPRGVFLRDYKKDIQGRNNKAPVGWQFDPSDWWVEEHGLIMEAPSFPLEKGRYLVTGGRLVTTVLEIGEGGKWSLEKGELFDVTHLPCRSARYTPQGGVGSGSPLTAKESDFPVKPGAEMPKVDGCDKVDYAVLFVIGKEA